MVIDFSTYIKLNTWIMGQNMIDVVDSVLRVSLELCLLWLVIHCHIAVPEQPLYRNVAVASQH